MYVTVKLFERSQEGPGACRLEREQTEDDSQGCASDIKMLRGGGTCGVGVGGERAVSLVLRAGGNSSPTAALCSLTGVCIC